MEKCCERWAKKLFNQNYENTKIRIVSIYNEEIAISDAYINHVEKNKWKETFRRKRVL